MAVRFKFRSSATFDSIDIGGQSSISIRDLKFKIINKKHLNLCQDFDLVFSDSLSGQEYKDENIHLPSGSSVIIKRVPAAFTSSLRACDVSAACFDGRTANCVTNMEPPSGKFEVNDSDDFGVDLHPLPDAKQLDLGVLQSNYNEKEDCMVPRASEELLVRYHELEAIYPNSIANDSSTIVMQSEPKIDGQTKLARTSPANHFAMENSDFPSELRCSLCRTIFKEAVMIPCCQHSFCKKCICLALAESLKCPICSSTKYKAEDLLPNVSLRQAIERFLNSQLLLNGSDNDLRRYAPDGESGIQVKDLSYAASVTQIDLQLNRSANGKISNQVIQNKSHDRAILAETKCKPGALEELAEFQGENEPQTMALRDEEDTCTKKGEGFRVIAGGRERNFTGPGRLNRGQRTCYRCGSPDHLIRDCPVAASSSTSHWNGDASLLPGSIPGCAQPYWPGSAPHVRPFVNMYGGPGTMLYNTTIAPVAPFAFPSYAPTMYGGFPVSGGHMGLSGMVLPAENNAKQSSHTELLELRGFEKQQGNYNGDLGREKICDRNRTHNLQHDYIQRGADHSDDSFSRRLKGKHRSHHHSDDDTYPNSEREEKISRPSEGGIVDRVPQSNRSTSEKDIPQSRIWHREDRDEKHYGSSRRNDERSVYHGDDSGKNLHLSKKESIKRRLEHDERKSDEYHSHFGSGMEHSYSGDGSRHKPFRRNDETRMHHGSDSSKSHHSSKKESIKRETRHERDCDEEFHSHSGSGYGARHRQEPSHRFKHSKKNAKSINMEVHDDRRKMNKYLDVDYEEDNYRHKRKRYH